MCFAAARADAAQSVGGLIKDVEEGCHGFSFGMTIHPVEWAGRQEK
jgi:hypothetical protein